MNHQNPSNTNILDEKIFLLSIETISMMEIQKWVIFNDFSKLYSMLLIFRVSRLFIIKEFHRKNMSKKEY